MTQPYFDLQQALKDLYAGKERVGKDGILSPLILNATEKWTLPVQNWS